MKILKQGTMPQKEVRIFRGMCINCGCEVECTDDEARLEAERHPGGKREWSVTCPFTLLSYKCGAKIILKEVIYRGENGTTILTDPQVDVGNTPHYQEL